MSNITKCRNMIIFEGKTALRPIVIYAVVVTILNLLGMTIFSVAMNGQVYESSFDVLVSGTIFVCIVAATAFSDDFRMLVQNCFTRMEIFFSQMIFIVGVSAVMTIVNIMLLQATEYISRLSFYHVFRYFFTSEKLPIYTEALLSFLFMVCIATATYAVTVLFNRFDKRLVGVGMLLFFVLLVTIITLTALNAPEVIRTILNFTLGVDEGGNPLNIGVTLTICAVANMLISYLLLRKIEI